MFYVEPVLMQKIACDLTGSEAPCFACAVTRDASLQRAFTHLYSLMLHSGDRLEKESCLYEALSRLVSAHAVQRAPLLPLDDSFEPIRMAQEYLLDNIAHNVSLGELSTLVGLSSSHLLRRFRSATGMPPHTYRLQQRINVAKRMLVGGTSIAQVAQDTGFTDQSHFTKRFKAFVGATPRQYQQANR
jgi:AraC-like DNA-binding protein